MRRASLALSMLVGAAFGAASSAFPLGDPDVYWHLATAREALGDGIVHADRFSWTVPGEPIPADQWLGQIAWYSAYLAGGWTGVLALRTFAVAILATLLAYAALRERPERPLFGLVAAAPALILSRLMWVERPELLGLICLAALVPLLRSGRTGSDVALLATVPLLVLWANLHGSFALGVVLTALVAAEGVLRERARIPIYVTVGAGALLALVATPSGLATAASPGLHFARPPREIMEWAVPDPATPAGLVWAATLAGLIAVAALSRRAAAHEVLTILPVAFLSLVAVRHMPLLPIVAAPYVASRLPGALGAFWRIVGGSVPVAGGRATGSRAPSIAHGAVVVIALAVPALAVAAAPDRPDERRYPTAALSTLPPGPGLFNHYDWGGWLIWRAPETPVFVDGRLVPYLGPVLDEYRRIISAGPGWREAIDRRGVRTLLVRPSDPVAVRARDLGWPEIASGEGFVLIAVPAGGAQ